MSMKNKVLEEFPGMLMRMAAEPAVSEASANPTEEYWGYHLILDCGQCDVAKMKDKDNVTDWITKLVPAIDMKPIGPPRVEYTAAEFPSKAGFTVVQVIITSDITAHFVDNLAQIYIDVFSCKPYDQSIVEESVRTHFGAKKMRKYYLTRQAD